MDLNEETVHRALDTIHEGNEVIFAIDIEVIGANKVTEMRLLFEKAYQDRFGEEVTIRAMKRGAETHNFLVMVLDNGEDPSLEEAE